MSIGSPVVISGGSENPQFASLANISVGLDDPNSFDETLLQELIDATPNILPIRDYRKAKTFTDKLMPSVLAKAFRGELIEQGDEGIRHG